VCGPNGAGKTTLLEAIYLVDRGRSFRGRKGGPATTYGEQVSSIGGAVRADRGRRLQLAWDSRNGLSPAGSAQLTRFVGVSTFNIIEGDPALRRQFFDWALFHVEHGARELWSRVDRVLRQRNAWLRSGGRGTPVWDGQYAACLAELWARRVSFLQELGNRFQRRTAELLPAGALELRWRWAGQGREIDELLAAYRAADLARGFTFLSPTRGDVFFLRDGREWRGSRGENKIAGILLQLAAQEAGASSTGKRSVVLLDDPYAEVSAALIAPILSAWMNVADQVVVTCLDAASTDDVVPSANAMFHVERGQLTRA
jgi:DNA replication and repair protein RecF